MFNKTHIDAYNSIKAPDELYNKIKNTEKKQKPVYLIPLVSTLAASIIIIFSVAAFGQSFNPNITFNGQQLTDSVVFYDISPSNALDMRSSPVLSVPVELELNEETRVSVSVGFLVLENGERVKYNTYEGKASFVWEIERTGEFSEAKMTLKSDKGTKDITLYENVADGSFTAEIN